ncbi:MAG TPA: hypothetical protein VGW33_06885 [Terriglobia bacterium]|nr:hypothetical protein [Terriglobia bacterium]
MVRVWSHHTGERTYIYAKDCGPHSPEIKLLVVTLDGSEAIVVQVKVNLNRLSDVMDGRDPQITPMAQMAGEAGHRE